jgi:hypothetical protein
VADQIIQISLDESELSDICPDSATLNSRYGGSNRVQDRLVRRVMPHRLARLKQDVSGFLNLHEEEQILERITSQDWSGLAEASWPPVSSGRVQLCVTTTGLSRRKTMRSHCVDPCLLH